MEDVIKLPDELNILGIKYSIIYYDRAADVEYMRGRVDHLERKIKVYRDERSNQDVFQTILHEVLHIIGEELMIDELINENKEKNIQLIAIALSDMLIRNGMLNTWN